MRRPTLKFNPKSVLERLSVNDSPNLIFSGGVLYNLSVYFPFIANPSYRPAPKKNTFSSFSPRLSDFTNK